MINHPGSFYGYESLAALREEELDRAAAARALAVQATPSRGRLRPRLAAGIRSLADRLDPVDVDREGRGTGRRPLPDA